MLAHVCYATHPHFFPACIVSETVDAGRLVHLPPCSCLSLSLSVSVCLCLCHGSRKSSRNLSLLLWYSQRMAASRRYFLTHNATTNERFISYPTHYLASLLFSFQSIQYSNTPYPYLSHPPISPHNHQPRNTGHTPRYNQVAKLAIRQQDCAGAGSGG